MTTRLADRLLLGAAALALLVILGLVVDAALVAGNYRLGQAALDTAAQAAATAVDAATSDAGWELRLVDSPDRPSAYTVAQQALGAAEARVQLLDVVSDGQRVLVRGRVAAPTFFLRGLGLSVIELDLLASAALQPPAGP